jgi:poly(hydroxyalkanoate) depolymerase family esterase
MRISRIVVAMLLGAASTLSASTKTTTALQSSRNPSTYGQTVTFTATVTPQPPNGEIITFSQGSTTLATSPLSGGSASFQISSLTTGGTDNIKAAYGGDSTFGASSKIIGQVVDAASTTTTLNISQNPINNGQSVTLTATVAPQYSGTVTGNVNFYSGSTKLGGNLSLSGGVASYTTTKLPLGSDSITAVYKGSSSFTTSTSSAATETVETGTFFYPTMTWDGVTRYYEVYVPAVLPANPPMLLMLHGTRYGVPPYNPSTIDWGWQSYADEFGFILVQPASTYNANTNQWNWNAYFMNAAFTSTEVGTCISPPATACPDDAGFLRQLIVSLTAQYNVNPNMVYVTGFSSGAQMTERVGVEISDLVAAIAPASGQMEGQQTPAPPPETPGTAVAPISVQEWQGTEDTELPPCNYGTTLYSGVKFYLDTVDDTFNYWVQQNDCTELQTSQTLCTDESATPNLSGNVATGCKGNNIEVQFIWEQGVGHSWQLKNNAARWSFLSSHFKSSEAAVRREDVHVMAK